MPCDICHAPVGFGTISEGGITEFNTSAANKRRPVLELVANTKAGKTKHHF